MLLLHKKYLIDESGKKTAVLLPYAEWRKVLEVLEEYDDILAYDAAKIGPSELIPFEEAIKQLPKNDNK